MASRGNKQSGGGSGGAAASGSGSHAKKNNRDSGSGQLQSGGDQPEEDPLVAVLLADSYDNHFAPLTLNWPRCLLPLANVPLLHYSVESATRAGVSHIYVLTRSHAHLIRQHVNDHLHNLLHSQGIAITVMSTPEARSEGDAIRELDAKQVLRSDFLLYRSDSVCTMDLRPVVDLHRKRRAIDKDAIMTMCCMQAGDQTTMRSKAMRPVQYIDPATNQILHYEQLPGLPKRKAVMPFELLRLDDKTGFDEIDVRFDLVDAGVYICSIDVPPLFSENFDYQSLSLDFIPGILTSDLLDSKIFLHVGKRGYGGRAQDTQTYDAISRDVLRRWTHPFTPASSAWLSERMTERRGWRYVGQEVQAHRSSNVGPCSMIASRCTLEPNVTITGSVLCEGVEIGNGSTISKSHIHPSVTVGKQVKMISCIIGKGARILDNVTLGRGCLIGADCVVGPNVSLPDGSRVGSKERESWDEEEEDEASKSNSSSDVPAKHDARVGAESKGVLWTNLWQKKDRAQTGAEEENESEDDEDGDIDEDIANLRLRAIGFNDEAETKGVQNIEDELEDNESVSSIAFDSEFGSDDEDLDGFSDDGRSTHSSSAFSHVSGTRGGVTNLTLDDEVDTQMEKEAVSARLAEFETEAKASLMRALEENHSIDNASLELKTLRMASNVSLRDVQKVVVETLLDRCKPADPKSVQALVVRWGKLIAQVSQDDEQQAVVVMQSYCASHPAKINLFVPLLKLFYNEDVVSDEAIVAWWRSKASQTGNEKMLDLRTRAQGVIRYILEDDDDEDEEDEDE
ncbi:nucleotide-diphospho-sugar transferase [Meira miltonrushii]|uniref:Translation initiation factor eIF2B subunit epsilon n=1 Tax=Meira miltonrushii TaxID=1280837 RepID=A0A316VDT8_9BASI|nr:nucleotide-diphospho-sugar transferase [Meira miltonrushii]PWN35742.1 nucleotide-diphospho-sugar transferase [Meira miltonrushii]